MHFASKIRTLSYGGRALRTPLLVPAFSSRAPIKKIGATLSQDEIDRYVAQIAEDVVGPALISAFDLHKDRIAMPTAESHVFGAQPTFIDSGGYENLSVIGDNERPGPDQIITEEQYVSVLKRWPEDVPVVAVNFDCEVDCLGEQINSAESLPVSSASGKILLLKASQSTRNLAATIAQIPDHKAAIRQLSAVGVTEKEAGASFKQRIKMIEELRNILNANDLEEMPIHVFGGLDPMRTYFYFLAGADIFDGTSWLRFGFEKGKAVYLDALASCEYPSMEIQQAEWLIRRQNLAEIVQMQISMRKFISSGRLADLNLDGSKLLHELFG